MHVLVTDDSYRPTLGIVRSLGKKGIRVSVLSAPTGALASHSRYCSARYVVPSPEEDPYLPALLDLLRLAHFDLLIPVGYSQTVVLAGHKSELGAFTRLEVADYEKVCAAADKHAMQELAARVGVPAPRTLAPASFDDVVRFAGEFQYPVVIKEARETPCAPVLYARNRRGLLRLYRPLAEQGNDGQSRLPLIQEFIPGFGCGFFALYQKGVCKRIFMHRRVRETPPSGGVSCCAESFYDRKLQDYGMRMLDRLAWHGVAMVEFRFDRRDSEYKLMEVNPKFWGSLDLALAAGVDFPYDLCQMAQGQDLPYSEAYDRNLRYHWPLLELQHLWMRPESFRAVVADLLNSQVKSNWSWRDVRPNLFEPFSRTRTRMRRLVTEKRRQYTGYPAFEK